MSCQADRGQPRPATTVGASEPTQARRQFLKRLAWAGAGLLAGGLALDAAYERHWLQVTRPRIAIPALPAGLDGLTVCHVTDIHHGPYLDLERVQGVVDLVLSLGADLIVLTGDMVHRSPKYTDPVWAELGRLRAPLGVFCVMGNHDHWEGIEHSRRAAQQADIPELNNRGIPISRRGARLWLAGVGDLYEDEQLLHQALAGVPQNEPAILLSHNPDYADEVTDPRVKLILAGHSHGGQIVLPLLGPPVVPCKQKYAMGLVKTDVSQVYISRGIGMAIIPFRINCRPELPVITLTGLPTRAPA